MRDDQLVLTLERYVVIGVPLAAFDEGDAARVVALARSAGVTVDPSAETLVTA